MIREISIDEISPKIVSEHGVICVRLGKFLEPNEFISISKRLGVIKPFGLSKYNPKNYPPEVTLIDTHSDGKNSAPRGFGEGWHQDSTFLDYPPEFTVLHSLDVPSSGGETLFADTRLALRSLSENELKTLRSLHLRHSVRSTYRVSEKDVGSSIEEICSNLPTSIHPLILAHPRGWETLYLSPLYTKNQLTTKVRTVFEKVLKKVLQNTIVHYWTAGDILIWDNRVVIHSATSYTGSERRRLMRTVVQDNFQKTV